MDDDVIYLNTNQVITINALQIRLYSPNELMGVKEPYLLESALNRPKQSILGKDAYPTIHEKATAFFQSLAQNHAFHNANKRTALASLIIFLKMNQYRWTMDTQMEQDFVVDVVNHKYTFEDIVATINKYAIKI
ncbi:type II toxin-antitoxin system death-on-curing family toxin [Ammoniphilus sp. CFH 90114]|uniref:type II toxin-antitoxin system death-on-curing family toxin n=1 Tax=Ammoniphilus sp. CFH 90114 TaxID=2493665 RepID=UPI00100F00FA|nr:type II toxin-antitoxin system death-on-curing family toxin [Ammoniphilus sp. CFH 90114]RXT07778.1 type II toxin-antitoxin system death-on-curing family toxin [Ammoniphilus sp. CFH 90114]